MKPTVRIARDCDIGGESFSLSSSGAFDEQGRRGDMSETVDGKTVTVIMALPYGYAQATGKQIKGKPWAGFNVEGYAQALERLPCAAAVALLRRARTPLHGLT